MKKLFEIISQVIYYYPTIISHTNIEICTMHEIIKLKVYINYHHHHHHHTQYPAQRQGLNDERRRTIHIYTPFTD